MEANVDVPAVTNQPTRIEKITIDHTNRTAIASIIGISGRGITKIVSIQSLLDAMTTTQKQTVNTFFKKCALLLWQEFDATVIENDITDAPNFDV